MNPPAAPRADRDAGPGPDLDLALLEREARRQLGEMPYAYFSGGAEDEYLLERNTEAFRHIVLHPRVLVDVSVIDPSTTVLGRAVDLPVMVAPTAIQGLAHPEGEVATARGASASGALSVLSSLATSSLEDVAAATPGAARWMQVYVLRDRPRTADLARRAAAAGYGALVLTVDAPVPGLRRREKRAGVHLPAGMALPNLSEAGTARAHEGGFMAVVAGELDPSLTPDDVTWLAGLTDLPVVVKGVLRADDARRCVDAGASAVIVSNHGARQLDDAPATADVLASVVDAVAATAADHAVGGRAEVYVDGGIRRAGDVAKALALGARAVLVGRPVLWALATGGEAGVARLFAWFGDELCRVMALCGAPTVADLQRSLIDPGVPAR